MPKRILTDSGYWLGLVDVEDPHHKTSLKLAKDIETFTVIIPWPCLYETLSTRLCKNKPALIKLEKELSLPNVEKLNDAAYNKKALELSFEKNSQGFKYSLVDCIIMGMLQDPDISFEGLITYNKRDFFDFLAQMRRIKLMDE